MTGRAPAVGVYSTAGRQASLRIAVQIPKNWSSDDDSLWPLIGWLAGKFAPDAIPLITGLESTNPSIDDLKGLCAAFGTTSGAPMLHIAGQTPEASEQTSQELPEKQIQLDDLREAWFELNKGLEKIDLVAIGSPHA